MVDLRLNICDKAHIVKAYFIKEYTLTKKKLRKVLELHSQAEVAKAVGCHQGTVSRVVNSFPDAVVVYRNGAMHHIEYIYHELRRVGGGY